VKLKTITTQGDKDTRDGEGHKGCGIMNRTCTQQAIHKWVNKVNNTASLTLEFRHLVDVDVLLYSSSLMLSEGFLDAVRKISERICRQRKRHAFNGVS